MMIRQHTMEKLHHAKNSIENLRHAKNRLLIWIDGRTSVSTFRVSAKHLDVGSQRKSGSPSARPRRQKVTRLGLNLLAPLPMHRVIPGGSKVRIFEYFLSHQDALIAGISINEMHSVPAFVNLFANFEHVVLIDHD